MRTLILASTSPYRLELMKRLDIPFKAVAPMFEEIIEGGVAPELLVKHFAYHKARSLREEYPDALIIGSDQVFVNWRGDLIGKPHTFSAARKQLGEMSGRKNIFYTGLTLYDSAKDEALSDFAVTEVTFRSLSAEEIDVYLHKEKPFDCAGSFKIEGLGIALMERVREDDPTALIGLPLIKLTHMLQEMGFPVLAQ
jgi:7-methyl-GTP pyrophosphatase